MPILPVENACGCGCPAHARLVVQVAQPSPKPMKYPFDRSEYRIPYPPTARPRFVMGSEERSVVDCSEKGLRYVGEQGFFPVEGAVVSGMVHLVSGGTPVEVRGTVVRVQNGEVAVHLDRPGIPVQRVFQEQRYLSRHFPARR